MRTSSVGQSVTVPLRPVTGASVPHCSTRDVRKKLLGYLDGTIAPYERSNSMVKDTAAELCMGSGASQSLPLATWTTARSCMIEVLESAVRKGKKQVPISTLKRLFRSRFHIELSETALGYTKLSDLLQDSCFHDICSVQLLERGYVV